MPFTESSTFEKLRIMWRDVFLIHTQGGKHARNYFIIVGYSLPFDVDFWEFSGSLTGINFMAFYECNQEPYAQNI